MKNNKLLNVLDILIAISIALAIICIAVTATLFFRPLYYSDIDRLDIVETSGLPEDEIRENYDVLIDYNTPWISSDLEFPTLPMSENGRTHFAEVRRIFVFIQDFISIFILFAVLLVWVKRFIFQRNPKLKAEAPPKKGKLLLLSGSVTLAVPIILGLVALLGWEKLFTLFHEVVFDNDYWIFNEKTDPVITILPDEFFMHCLIMIVSIIVAVAIILIAAGIILRRRSNSKPA